MENKKWYYNRDGVQEEVQMRKWIWAVKYKDGTEFKQYDDNGVFHQLGEIDQEKVKVFAMLCPSENKRYDILKENDMKIFLVYKWLGIIDGNSNRKIDIPMFGYKKTVRVDNKVMWSHTYHYILPSGIVLISSKEINLQEFNVI